MDNIQKCSLYKINKYLFYKIMKYINKEHFLYALRLVKYSKLFQQKLDIDLNDYKYECFRLETEIKFYFNFDYGKNFKTNNNNNKYTLTNKVYCYLKELNEEFNLSISLEEIIDIIRKYLEKHNNERKTSELIEDNFSNYYDIYSPFSDIIYKYYDTFLRIPLHLIKKCNLLNDYISFFKDKKFEKLIIDFFNLEEALILRDIEIDFSKIRMITFQESFDETEEKCSFFTITKKNERKFNKDDFLFEIFSFLKKVNNIESFKFAPLSYKYNPYFFTPLNNFKNLTNINLILVELSKPFTIILPNLQSVYFYVCKNIYLDCEKTTINIKNLKLERTDMEYDSIYKFDNLEELSIENSFLNIDFNSLKNLRTLSTVNPDIIKNALKCASIEKLLINQYDKKLKENNFTLEDETEIFELILNHMTLKKLKLFFYNISDDQLKKISKYNKQLNELNFNYNMDNFDYIYFIKRFPNL